MSPRPLYSSRRRLVSATLLEFREKVGSPIGAVHFETVAEHRVRRDRRHGRDQLIRRGAEMQRDRLLERGVDLDRLEGLLARQMPDAEKRRRADFVVDSSKGIEHARGEVQSILAAVANMPARRR